MLEPLSEAGDSCCSTPLLTARERKQGRSGFGFLPWGSCHAHMLPLALGWVRDASCSDCHLRRGALGKSLLSSLTGTRWETLALSLEILWASRRS